MTEDKDNQDFDDFLKGNSELSRRYREASKQQPAKHLDEAIIAAAHEEVAKKPGVVVSPFARNWYVPITLAAVLVLCVGLVFNIYQDAGQELLTTPQPVSEFDILSDQDGRIDTIQPARKLERSETTVQPKAKILLEKELQERRPAFETQDAPAAAMDEILLDKKDAGIKSRAAKPEDIEMIWQQNKKQENEPATKAMESPAELHGYQALEEKEVRKNDTIGNATESSTEVLAKDPMKRSSDDGASQLYRDKSSEEFLSMTPEDWLQEISKLWQRGEKDGATKSLKQFFQIYPDYPLESARTILPDGINISDFAN